MDDEGEKEVGCFFGVEFLWEVGFCVVFFYVVKGWVSEYDVDFVVCVLVVVGFGEVVVVFDVGYFKVV